MDPPLFTSRKGILAVLDHKPMDKGSANSQQLAIATMVGPTEVGNRSILSMNFKDREPIISGSHLIVPSSLF